MGSIQEDRHKVEQFHNLWNCSTFCGSGFQKCGTAPQRVEQRVTVPLIVHDTAQQTVTKLTKYMLFQIVEQHSTSDIVP